MLAQIVTSAIAQFFSNAAAGISAALLMNRSTKVHAPKAPDARRLEQAFKVQLWVAKGVSTDRNEFGSLIGAEQFEGSYTPDPVAAEIRKHRDAIARYESSATGPDPQLRILARDILPHLQQHLAMLESLQSENTHARR